jgi:hypothetical protein
MHFVVGMDLAGKSNGPKYVFSSKISIELLIPVGILKEFTIMSRNGRIRRE